MAPTLTDLLKEKLRLLPDQPGVYRFLNRRGTVLYIGKAKSLKKRVSSYFISGYKHSYRIGHLVENIHDIAYTVVNSESEALLLENNLIKQYQPKYNILLKDGKTYPYICIKNERFPRIFSTRTKESDGSAYFGPYPNGAVMYAILELFRSLVPLRTCSFDLSEKNIAAGKFKVCLEYQIGNCGGACEGKVSEADYNAGIEQLRHILKGHLKPVVEQLEAKMMLAVENLEFEKAEIFKRRIEKVKNYRQKSTVVSESVGDVEVLTVEIEEHLAVVNHFKVHQGSIIQTHALEFKCGNQETEAEVLAAAFEQLLGDEVEFFENILVNVSPDAENLSDETQAAYTFTVPKIGDKRHLVDLSLKNCKQLLTEKLYKQNQRERKTPGLVLMQALQKELSMNDLPDHIECFDNSNFQGTNAVAACVVFKDGKPSNRDYRHFNIKTVEGPNDFASMKEIVTRRYRRQLDESQPLPKLIIIDGGKGQLGMAVEALTELGLMGKIPVVGIAKRLEEIYRPGDPVPLHIDKKSPALRLIQQLRDEAHRFGITFHRDQRSRDVRHRSHLTEIKGIGEKTMQEILREFKSIKKLKAATPEERETKLGKRVASLIVQAIERGEL